MKKRYVVGVTMLLWSAVFVLVLGSAAPVAAIQLEWKGDESIGKTVEASFEHKDRDVSSQSTGIDLSYQGPFYLVCDENGENCGLEKHKRANKPASSITLSEIADLPTIDDKINDESENFVLVLTLTSLEELKAEDIPDKSWIDNLKPLTGQEFDGEESFWAAVAVEIGQPLIDQYGELILEHAYVRQADSTATSTVETSRLASDRIHFEIDLDDVIGNSYYNATTTDPKRHDEDMEAYLANPEEFVQKHGSPPPGVECDQTGECIYYSNWEMASADSHAYGGYGGTGNIFSVDDGDNIADEQLWVSAVYSYKYDLSGGWTYHTVTNTHQAGDPSDDVMYNERTGHFYTSFQSYLNIGNGVEQFEYEVFEDMWRNDELVGTSSVEGLEMVTQELSGEFTTSFSFLVTEGIEYTFDMFADVYGYCDGFADYLSSGWATLDLMVMEDIPHTPEPATSLLLVIGIFGLYWYRKRFHKR